MSSARTIELVTEIAIDRPAAEVWEVVADYGRDPEWRAGVRTMAPRPPGLVGVGTTTAEELRFAGRTWHNDGEVVEVDPGHRFAWRTVRGAVARGSRTVVAAGARRCTVRLELEVEPRGSERAMAPLLRLLLRRDLVGDARRLRSLVEGQPEASRRDGERAA